MKFGKLVFAVALCLFTFATSYSQTESENAERPGPITRPMVVEIAHNTYFINEFGMNALYVLIGEESALLIDAGTGFYDFKSIVEQLTDLPYKVVITHGHPDHAGGINQFDTIYIHPADTGRIHIPYEQKVQYGEIMRNMGIGYKDVWGYIPDDVIQNDNWPVIELLHDQQVFDLGGRKVTVYEAPGHSPGSVAFLDPYSRILFSGDAANGNVGTRLPVSTTLRHLIRLKELQTDYDRMFTGHISYASSIDVYSQDLEVLDDIIEAFRSILRGDADVQEVANHLFPERKSIVAVYGRARVGFDPENLWEEGEEHVVF